MTCIPPSIRTQKLPHWLWLLLGAAIEGGCIQGQRPKPLPLDPHAALQDLAAAARHRDISRIGRLLSPSCRAGCEGFAPVVIESTGHAGYQVVRWVPRLESGTLLGDLAVALLSYRHIDRFDLQPLHLRDFGTRVDMRVLLEAWGTDLDQHRRTDRGLLDVVLIKRASTWRFSRLATAWIHTVRRAGPGYRRLAGEPEPEPAARAGRWWSIGRREPPSGPVVAFDFDGDGLVDLVDGAARRLRWRRGDGEGRFGPPARLDVGLTSPRDLLAGDVDGDGRSDLFVVAQAAGRSGLWLNHRRGWRRSLSVPGVARAGVLADLDGDGHLDLFVVRHAPPDAGPAARGSPDLLYRGDGSGRLTEVGQLGGDWGLAACAGDLDGDGRIDLLVGNELSPARLWLNRGAGRFVDRTARSGLRVPGLVTACAVGDVDGDGRLDLYLGGLGARGGYLFGRPGHQIPGAGWIARAEARARLRQLRLGSTLWLNRSQRGRVRFEQATHVDLGWTRRAAMVDHDNDGDLDLLVQREVLAASAEARWWQQVLGPLLHHRRVRPLDSVRAVPQSGLYLNASERSMLLEATFAAGLQRRSAIGASLDAIGRDRALDLIAPSGRFWTWRGGAGELDDEEARHGVLLRLRARGRGNRDALGCRVDLLADGRRQVRIVGVATGLFGGPPGYVHFGVGRSVRVEQVTVRWPDGEQQRIVDLPVDRSVLLVQGRPAEWRSRGVARPVSPSRRAHRSPAEGAEPDAEDEAGSGEGSAANIWRQLPARRVLAPALGAAATLVLIAPAACRSCGDLCRQLGRLRRGLEGLGVAAIVASQPAGPAQIPGCDLRTAAVTEERLRAVTPVLPATVLIDRQGRIVRIDAGVPRREQLQVDLHRLDR